MYFGMCLETNQTDITFLTLEIVSRKSRKETAHHLWFVKYAKWVPDVAMTDMNVLAQLIADGNLRDAPPPSYSRLKRTLVHVHKHARVPSHEEQRKNEMLRQKLLSEIELPTRTGIVIDSK